MTTATTTESLGALQLALLNDAVRRDGEWGELVFTSLTKEAMPVVRYRTRDLRGSSGARRTRRTGGWRRSRAAATT